MNRNRYYDYIDDHLNALAYKVKSRGKLNLLDIHNHSENFYQFFLKELYDWDLENLNNIKTNVEAIDLIDKSKKIFIQISAVCTKNKIEASLEKNSLKKFPGYTFKFVSIVNDANSLRKLVFNNPNNIKFQPTQDIIDVISILKDIKDLEINNQKKIYDFIKLELGEETDFVKLDSNLVTIINILSKEDWDPKNDINEIDTFEIERKMSFNKLNLATEMINDYALYHSRLNDKYSEFDRIGQNKSRSILGTIRNIYIKAEKSLNNDELFFNVTDEIKKKIINSSNYTSIPEEELDLCINILTVDAFIRCKIFKNPKGYKYASS